MFGSEAVTMPSSRRSRRQAIGPYDLRVETRSELPLDRGRHRNGVREAERPNRGLQDGFVHELAGAAVEPAIHAHGMAGEGRHGEREIPGERAHADLEHRKTRFVERVTHGRTAYRRYTSCSRPGRRYRAAIDR
jgi:hypothetical protein